MKLIEFDKGVWLDPETVTSVAARVQRYFSEVRLDRAMVVLKWNGGEHCIFCDSVEGSVALAEELAKKANGMVKVNEPSVMDQLSKQRLHST